MGMTDEIQAYIAANIPQWILPSANPATGNIFTEFLPSGTGAPDEACALHQLPGSRPQLTLGNQVPWTNPRLVVRNRGVPNDLTTPFSDAEAIKKLLQTVRSVSLSGTNYLCVIPTGEPAAESWDPSNRLVVTTSYDVSRVNP